MHLFAFVYLYFCICVCLYIYIYVCFCLFAFVCICLLVYVYLYLRICIYFYWLPCICLLALLYSHLNIIFLFVFFCLLPFIKDAVPSGLRAAATKTTRGSRRYFRGKCSQTSGTPRHPHGHLNPISPRHYVQLQIYSYICKCIYASAYIYCLNHYYLYIYIYMYIYKNTTHAHVRRSPLGSPNAPAVGRVPLGGCSLFVVFLK